jgi:hypothetical protein
VSEDELAFLWPSLQSASPVGAGDVNPHAIFRRALAARLHDLARRCGGSPELGPGDAAADAVLRTVARAGVINSAPLDELVVEGARAWSKVYYQAPAVSADRQSASFWRFELSVLASLDLAVSPSSGADLSDAVVASIYSGVNAAYELPHLAFAHELLTVGAWLGYLIRGRAALMPPFIAERLIDQLGGTLLQPEDDAARCEALVRFHAEAAVGARRLLQTAKRVYKSNTPALVRPAGATDRLTRPVWNGALTNFSVAD